MKLGSIKVPAIQNHLFHQELYCCCEGCAAWYGFDPGSRYDIESDIASDVCGWCEVTEGTVCIKVP